ncbi:MAG: glyoxalase [Bacteroidetes bacterium]|jgi:catechol 2,3-dioxygenase-like lactoylglutathione lyase family enzyme|nr:glyoxalase [Bacteroidota bacterium]|tara:strand:- start:721 stop:1776 length:1056 start_codon:yes stop_codon:yes gene_type:complete
MAYIVAGIQQLGIGVSNLKEARDWYQKILGYDVIIFDEAAEANLMSRYTDNQIQTRHAVLTYNMKGGGGFEVWQNTSRTPEAPSFEIQLGDLGIFIGKIKAPDIHRAFKQFQKSKVNIISEINNSPEGKPHFFIKDPYNNIFEIEQGTDWLLKQPKVTGGNSGVIIGVSDMDRSIKLYSQILGYETVVYDQEKIFNDLTSLPGGNEKYRRVLLKHENKRIGPFSPMLGDSTIELIQAVDHKVRKIYEDRLWGDLGYIHLCFDIIGMHDLKTECEAAGYNFTVDSAVGFDMGEAAGHFSYIEDPDGTLIEFVETHKIPIIKKIGWYLNITKRKQKKPLPMWFFKILGASRKI